MLGVATAVMIATAPGQTVIVSQFNTAFRNDFDLSAKALSTSYLIGTVAAALPLVFVGRLSDRFGPRAVTLAVALCFAAACAAIGQARGVVTLTLGFFCLRFLGQGSLGLLSGHTLALWFERRLGFATGIKLVGAQFGFAVLPAVALMLIDSVGWRHAYLYLGLGSLALVAPLVLLVSRDHPEHVGQRLDGGRMTDPPPDVTPGPDPAFTLTQALRSATFWIIVLTIALNGLIGTALIFHSQPLLEAAGLDIAASPAVLRTWSLTVMALVFPAGWLADHLSARTLLPASLLLLALASLVPFIATGSLLAMHAAFACFGVSQSLMMGAGAPTIARYFGRAHHGSIRAVSTKIAVVGTGLGPLVLGISLDETGALDAGLIVFAASCVPLAIACAFIGPPRKPRA